MLARAPRASTSERRPQLPLRLKEQLALCSQYPERVLFLDIETTGLSHHYDEITVVGWSIGGRASTMIKGESHQRLVEDAKEALALVTFNGIRFDQRFIRQEFPDVTLPPHHIDLMYLCRRVALTGGQKAIERELAVALRGEIANVDGFAAVLLWHRYLRGDIAALETLVRYNRADIAAMGAIFDHVIDRLGIEPDLFLSRPVFKDWAAPAGWIDIPQFGTAAADLSSAPDFDQLLGGSLAEGARVVGIDLTGSEARGSGWCLLNGKEASFKTVFTDEEILQHTLSSHPDLVSIDSPLCLPAGRTSVEDSDPGRVRFGIMRECERELKRRGVNVYPCLLPSMQKLTARGIRLARSLRRLGVPVIESYPGAAQDIMRIPRKGAGVEWLKLGLTDFGVIGDLSSASHDELDAITSALVGSFHWAGLVEALGTSEEPPLIVPKLDGKTHPFIIGISGPIAAGKTTMARTLEKMGFAYTRFSLVIDDELRAQGQPLDRKHRQALGSEINRTGRQTWLAERTLSRVGEASAIVVDGLRFPEDHAFLAERSGGSYVHIFVDADEGKRRQRYLARSSDKDFDAVANSDVESQVESMRSLAHYVFPNEGCKDEIDPWAAELAAQIKESRCQFPS
ncbi:ribonuclease H-like domain-containing protein [Mesorhizobium sp. WSM3626]|uniref:ribonuclease H-like domain-containing protein n=1 Tax=Mesorhizobium sp. WSM3626 TaxID=1040987 RepID=UPI0004B16933|nr:ribonuclease H-like domain-containing protein [Mesorhizobium sp. WSM3626]